MCIAEDLFLDVRKHRKGEIAISMAKYLLLTISVNFFTDVICGDIEDNKIKEMESSMLVT
jgi:hypothetical protein